MFGKKEGHKTYKIKNNKRYIKIKMNRRVVGGYDSLEYDVA